MGLMGATMRIMIILTVILFSCQNLWAWGPHTHAFFGKSFYTGNGETSYPSSLENGQR